MRLALYSGLAAALLFLGGCGPARPMTQSEFNGFCYQSGQGQHQSCGSIAVCGNYAPALNMVQPTLRQCLDQCSAIHDAQVWTYINTDCAASNDDARDWCQRFCRTNYTK